MLKNLLPQADSTVALVDGHRDIREPLPQPCSIVLPNSQCFFRRRRKPHRIFEEVRRYPVSRNLQRVATIGAKLQADIRIDLMD